MGLKATVAPHPTRTIQQGPRACSLPPKPAQTVRPFSASRTRREGPHAATSAYARARTHARTLARAHAKLHTRANTHSTRVSPHGFQIERRTSCALVAVLAAVSG
eukprot:569492-Pleurochrysis_carterae.AAC.1